jgi:hypothetical protein
MSREMVEIGRDGMKGCTRDELTAVSIASKEKIKVMFFHIHYFIISIFYAHNLKESFY